MNRSCHCALFAAALLASCSSDEQEPAAPPTSRNASPVPAATPDRTAAYTSLADCPVLESHPEEAGYYLSECAGEGGYKLRVIEADLRQTVEVIPPGGVGQSLDLASITGGGFSTLGENAEWRGALEKGAFAPDTLILRHEVVTDPDGKKTLSYLVAVKLAGVPCVVARIEPGPDQNAKARTAADAGGPCLADSSRG